IPRPLNRFMLYRKCHRALAAEFCKTILVGQQGVSIVCGVSWRLEPEEVRDKFRDWHAVETENHRKAFPRYKFAPGR
ncbi:hypothetical protein BT67DRAFT_337059, partial [Trichocladium antarcticum]